MARIFKHTYTKPLPEGAELFTRKGKRFARFKDSKGRTATAPLSRSGEKIIVEAAKWYVDYIIGTQAGSPAALPDILTAKQLRKWSLNLKNR